MADLYRLNYKTRHGPANRLKCANYRHLVKSVAVIRMSVLANPAVGKGDQGSHHLDCTLVVSAKQNQNEQLVTVSLNSEFIAAGQVADIIEAVSEVVRRTRSLAFVRGQVFVGDQTLLNTSAVLKLLKPR